MAGGWGVILVLGLAAIAAVVLSVILGQGMKTGRVTEEACIKAAQETAYRDIAERAALAQETIVQQLRDIQEHVADIRSRATVIERMMREVE